MASKASASALKLEKDLEELMGELGIEEEDLDDLAFEDVITEDAPESRWLTIGKVHTSWEYGAFWFYKKMRNTWDLTQTAKFRSLGNNLYTMQFSCLGDWDKVMEGGLGPFEDN
ncbi:hypothetical protein D1007_36381 [Hordeum vulgare]|nr:hypothetical protein D1007_36381 [Hordeum vulgare]